MDIKKFIKLAIEASYNAYAPYSNFQVGAAVETESGRIYTGSNIENASYSATICAERVAISKAISEGYEKIKTLIVYGKYENEQEAGDVFPCGICRQFVSEFASDDLKILIASSEDNYKIFTLNELMPHSFSSVSAYK